MSAMRPAPRNQQRYVLAGAHIPPGLVAGQGVEASWFCGDILVDTGKIAAVTGTGQISADSDIETIDLAGSIVLSGLVDCHVHLDKAHVSAFARFPPCDLAGAIAAMAENKKTWTPDSLTARAEFSLRSAYAYGVRAMRTHVDCAPDAADFIWPVLRDLARDWRGRIELQLCPLVGVDTLKDPDFCHKAFALADEAGLLGLFIYDQPGMKALLSPLFQEAKARGWDIDLHVDEGVDDRLNGLEAVADTVLETGYPGTVLCGHSVALITYEPDRRRRVIEKALSAGLHFVSLPVTNLYLQDRTLGEAPRVRGMAPVRELAAAGATVSFGADNVRDGFCAFGEFDPVSVLALGAQVAHLEEPLRDFASFITTAPAATMGLAWDGMITAGAPAGLVILPARTSAECCARPMAARQIIRAGRWQSDTPPAFSELDGKGQDQSRKDRQ